MAHFMGLPKIKVKGLVKCILQTLIYELAYMGQTPLIPTYGTHHYQRLLLPASYSLPPRSTKLAKKSSIFHLISKFRITLTLVNKSTIALFIVQCEDLRKKGFARNRTFYLFHDSLCDFCVCPLLSALCVYGKVQQSKAVQQMEQGFYKSHLCWTLRNNEFISWCHCVLPVFVPSVSDKVHL